MLCVVVREQELVSWVTTKVTAYPVTPELGLVLEELMMTPTRVETRLYTEETMGTSISKPWDTSWSSDDGKELIILKFKKLKGGCVVLQ